MPPQANPRMPLNPPPIVLRAAAPWLQSQCHLENAVDTKLSHSENQNPLTECPRWWHTPPAREGREGHSGVVCALPRLHPQGSQPRSDIQGLAHAQALQLRCAHHAWGRAAPSSHRRKARHGHSGGRRLASPRQRLQKRQSCFKFQAPREYIVLGSSSKHHVNASF